MGIDPRGVGHSTPELRCRTDAEFDAYRREPMADYSPAGVAHIEQLYSQIAASCTEKMGTEFLANVGTASAVSDMDVVRAALGENQINYLGFSYGTELGAAYAERYPDRVRAMVLDGAVDPSLDPIARRIRQMAGFQTAFNDYAADCAQSPGCPLGTDPTQFVDRYHELVNPLVNQPARTSDPRGLSYQDAITGTVNALYSRRYWTYLTSGLLGLQRGTDPGDLLLLADDYQDRDTSGHYSNQQDAFPAIRCVDAPYPTEPAVWADADRQMREAAPFLAYGELHRIRSARLVHDVAGAADVDAAAGVLTRARQGRRRLDDPRPRHAVSGRRRPGSSDGRIADHLRRHAAHRGVQRRRVRRHRRGELPGRLGGSTGGSALLIAVTV